MIDLSNDHLHLVDCFYTQVRVVDHYLGEVSLTFLIIAEHNLVLLDPVCHSHSYIRNHYVFLLKLNLSNTVSYRPFFAGNLV